MRKCRRVLSCGPESSCGERDHSGRLPHSPYRKSRHAPPPSGAAQVRLGVHVLFTDAFDPSSRGLGGSTSEKRLARALLLLVHFGKETKPETVIAKISQETLAEMIGTARSRVSFFMNKFRKLGSLIIKAGCAEMADCTCIVPFSMSCFTTNVSNLLSLL